MPVFVKKAIEPGSRASQALPAILADSDASQRLRLIVKRYVEGNVTGRSFLISGHRGAGKTTLVKKVVDEVRGDFASRTFRPLLVSMSGPMLLPPDGKDSAQDETKAVLEQLTVNLYRALARHFADCYGERVSRMFTSPPAKKRTQAYLSAMESADAFRLKLDGPIELAELRGMWDSVGALSSGILFADATKSQGTLEIGALWSCLRAYLSLASDYTQKAGSSDTAVRKSETSGKATIDKGVLSALLGVGTGSAVGAALLASNSQDRLLATFSAVAAAIASSLVLNFSFSKTREANESLESSISMKHDMQSLARELPELLQRCRDAGIVPVFLIDELDKVEKLEKRMESLIYSSKLLVTEQSLFFFVTDRSYYEYIDRLCRSKAYPREHTFFSERLFVSYQPKNWRSFLTELLVPGSTTPEQQALEQEAIDILGFVLLCRSRMHAIDLRRAIASIAEVAAKPVREDVESLVRIDPADLVKQRRYLFEVLMQVAVEVTLVGDPDFSGRCAAEPPFTQLAYDSLYYLARKWEMAPRETFQVRDRDDDDFRTWLASRSEGLFGEGDDGELPYLLSKVAAVQFWLENPTLLADKVAATRSFAPKVVEMLRATPPLVAPADQPRTYRWQFDVFGRPLYPQTVERIRDDQGLQQDRAMIRAVSDAVKESSREKIGLGAIQKLGLVTATPLVSVVFESLDRLRNLDSSPLAYPEMDEDAQCVSVLAASLRKNGDAVAGAVIAGWILSILSAYSDPNRNFSNAWDTLNSWVYSSAADAPSTCVFLRKLFYRVLDRLPIKNPPNLKTLSLEQYKYDQWSQSLTDAVNRITGQQYQNPVQWPDIQTNAWTGWADASARFLQRLTFEYGVVDDYTIDQMLARALGRTALRWLRPDLTTVSISDWSSLILNVLVDGPSAGPSWAAGVGLIATGHDSAANNLLLANAREGESWPADLLKQYRNRLFFTPSVPTPTPQPTVLLWSLKNNSIAANWLPDAPYACLMFNKDEGEKVAKLLISLPTLQPDFVLVEPDPSQDTDSLSRMNPVELISRELPFLPKEAVALAKIGLLVSRPVMLPSPTVPVLSSPTSLRDAITRLIGQTASARNPKGSQIA